MSKVFFGEFNMPVKASRIKRAKKYSDVKIITPGVGSTTVKVGRPKREFGYEPEYTVKK